MIANLLLSFRSTLFVSVFRGSLLVIALFRAIADQFSSNIFLIFLILVSWKNKAISASWPVQKYHSSSRFPSLFLSSLESFSVLFLRAKLGECVALWFALTPPPLKWLTEQKNPFEVCKRAAWYNEFGYKTVESLSWPSSAVNSGLYQEFSYPWSIENTVDWGTRNACLWLVCPFPAIHTGPQPPRTPQEVYTT